MSYYAVMWREDSGDAWETQEEFDTSREAHDWIGERPDGGNYRVVRVPVDDEI
jgi:hypothetical protein